MKVKKYLERVVRFGIPYLNRLEMVRLDRNERTSRWPAEVWKEIQKAVSPEVIMSYPELDPAYDKLSSFLKVDRKKLLLSHGSDAGLKSIFEVYIGEGDEALSISPSYAMYPVYAGMVGAKPVEISFLEDLSLPFELILKAISDRTRIVCLPNPNQPIERVFTKEELETVFQLALKKDFLIVVDEAYHYFYPETVIVILSLVLSPARPLAIFSSRTD